MQISELKTMLEKLDPDEQEEALGALRLQLLQDKAAKQETIIEKEPFRPEESRSCYTIPVQGCDAGTVNVCGITLLSVDQFQTFKDMIPCCKEDWWLLDTVVMPGNEVRHYSVSGKNNSLVENTQRIGRKGIRPALVLASSAAKSNLVCGKFLFRNVFYTVLSPSLALADECISSQAYRDSFLKCEWYDSLRNYMISECEEVQFVPRTIHLGKYHQGIDGAITAIEWIPLYQDGKKMLLISRFVLDINSFSYNGEDWEKSLLKKWLNQGFYKEAFSEKEKRQIIPYIRPHPDYHDPKYAPVISDNVFLLSHEEARIYLFSDQDRMCRPTAYASIRNKWYQDQETVPWWCIDHGYSRWRVSTIGKVSTSDAQTAGVRPCIWIRTD